MWAIFAFLASLFETSNPPSPAPLQADLSQRWLDLQIAAVRANTPDAQMPDLNELDLGPATSLGPGELNLEAMAALDAQMTDLRALAIEEAEALIEIAFAEPFECDLDLMTALLTQVVNDAPEETIARWSALVEASPVADMPRETKAENCAINQTMMNLMDEAILIMERPCAPIERALSLARAVAQVPSELQPGFARELSVLAQKQQDYRFLGRPPTDLCPDYAALETRLLSAVRG